MGGWLCHAATPRVGPRPSALRILSLSGAQRAREQGHSLRVAEVDHDLQTNLLVPRPYKGTGSFGCILSHMKKPLAPLPAVKRREPNAHIVRLNVWNVKSLVDKRPYKTNVVVHRKVLPWVGVSSYGLPRKADLCVGGHPSVTRHDTRGINVLHWY